MKNIALIITFLIAGCGPDVLIQKQQPCTVQNNEEGAVISCPDGTSAMIQNGVDGQDVIPADLDSITAIDPCGDADGIVDEVLLRLQDGTLLAGFSSGHNGKGSRLTILTPGTYSTRDGSHCVFEVDADGNVTEVNYMEES